MELDTKIAAQHEARKSRKRMTADEIATLAAENEELIKAATEEQWDAIRAYREDWLKRTTTQWDPQKIITSVTELWESLDIRPPAVMIARSPVEAVYFAIKALRTANPKEYEDKDPAEISGSLPKYWSVWWRAWAGWYHASKSLGVKYDEEELRVFTNWADSCPFVVSWRGMCVVSMNPVELHFQGDDLHNEEGPAVRFSDGYCVWSIDGVRVNQTIVECPETLTADIIDAYDNEEVRRIAIERYTWIKYLGERNAQVIETADNPIEGTLESLMSTDRDTVFVGACPSTGRTYAMQVDRDIKTIEEAKAWLQGNDLLGKMTILGAS